MFWVDRGRLKMAINLPIPCAVSLASLYQRWGYLDTPAGYKIFCDEIRRFIYVDGLRLDYYYDGRTAPSFVEREKMDDFIQSFLIPDEYYPQLDLAKEIILDYDDDNIIKGDNRTDYWNYIAMKMPKDWVIYEQFTRHNIRVVSLEPASGDSLKDGRFCLEVSSDYTPLYFLRRKLIDQEYILQMKNNPLIIGDSELLIPEFIDEAKYLQELASHENMVGSLRHPVFVAFKELNLSMYDIHITRDNLKEFEQRMGICDHGLKPVTAVNNKPKKPSLNEQRIAFFKDYIANKEIKGLIKKEVWEELKKANPSLFKAGDDDFFKVVKKKGIYAFPDERLKKDRYKTNI